MIVSRLPETDRPRRARQAADSRSGPPGGPLAPAPGPTGRRRPGIGADEQTRPRQTSTPSTTTWYETRPSRRVGPTRPRRPSEAGGPTQPRARPVPRTRPTRAEEPTRPRGRRFRDGDGGHRRGEGQVDGPEGQPLRVSPRRHHGLEVRWFNDRNYQDYLVEDWKIRDYLMWQLERQRSAVSRSSGPATASASTSTRPGRASSSAAEAPRPTGCGPSSPRSPKSTRSSSTFRRSSSLSSTPP